MKENIRLGFELKKTMSAFSKRIEHSYFMYSHPELSQRSMFILNYLFYHQNEAVYQKDIEKEFSVHKSTISDLISNMEKHGYLLRHSPESDARYRSIELTDSGKEIVEGFKKELDKIELELQKQFTNEELMNFMNNLIKIRNCLKGE